MVFSRVEDLRSVAQDLCGMRCHAGACVRSFPPAVHGQHTIHHASGVALHQVGRGAVAHPDRYAAIVVPRGEHRRLYLVHLSRVGILRRRVLRRRGRVRLFADVVLRRPVVGALFLENGRGRRVLSGRDDGIGSRYDATQHELPHGARFADQHRAHGVVPDRGYPLLLGSRRAALHLHRPRGAARARQAFAAVAVNGGLPAIAGIVFVVGLVSCTYSAAGSALTSLTTSFTLDILDGAAGYDEARLARLRKRIHLAMALVMTVVIVAFDRFGNDSVINLVFRVAGYTYGPILGLFVFGMACRRRIRERYVPAIAVLSPALSWALQWWTAERYGYHIGFELLGYNALFTILGLFLISYRHDEKVS